MMNLLEKIGTINISEYPRIWDVLNSWEFPDDLKEFQPDMWELLSDDDKLKIIWPVMVYIQNIIPYKELLRYRNKNNLVGNEFDKWWENISKDPLLENINKFLQDLSIASGRLN